MPRPAWEQFSTTAVHPPQRIHRWNDYGSATLCDMIVDPSDRDCFDAQLARIEFGPLGLVAMRSTGARASSGYGGVSCWGSRERDAVCMTVIETGTCSHRQGKVSREVDPGGIFFLDLTRPWLFACSGDMAMRMVKIPYSALASRIEDPERLLRQLFDPCSPAVAMIGPMVRSVHEMLRNDPVSGADVALSELMLDSVALLYSTGVADRPDGERREQPSLRRAATNYIAHNIEDPQLSVAGVAAALSVSQRQLQRAFVVENETAVQVILAQRLDLAAIRLARGPGARRTSILDTALSVGFNDASHFSRSFARRFGVSPRRYRGTPPL
jgi:AraC-like DNA-binding protein